jgi:heme/copper-type cytochrome/quinol oxidase subunit 4
MQDISNKSEYCFTIESINREDKKHLLENRRISIKYICIGFSIIIFIIAIAMLPLGLTKDDLEADLIIIAILLSIFLLTVLVLFVHQKIGLKDKYKIIETGTVTRQQTVIDDIGETKYTYLGTEAFTFVPGNIKPADRISIEHSLNKKNRKNLFIKCRQL